MVLDCKRSLEVTEQLCVRYQHGESIYALSQLYGISRRQVERIIKEAGITPQAWYKRLPYSQEIINEYQQGLSLKALQRRYGYSQNHVIRVIRSAGLSIRSAGEQYESDNKAGRLLRRSGSWRATIRRDVPLEGGLLDLVSGLLLGDGSIRFDNGPPTLCIACGTSDTCGDLLGVGIGVLLAAFLGQESLALA